MDSIPDEVLECILCVAVYLLDCIDAFDPDTVGSDPSIQAGSGLRCGR